MKKIMSLKNIHLLILALSLASCASHQSLHLVKVNSSMPNAIQQDPLTQDRTRFEHNTDTLLFQAHDNTFYSRETQSINHKLSYQSMQEKQTFKFSFKNEFHNAYKPIQTFKSNFKAEKIIPKAIEKVNNIQTKKPSYFELMFDLIRQFFIILLILIGITLLAMLVYELAGPKLKLIIEIGAISLVLILVLVRFIVEAIDFFK